MSLETQDPREDWGAAALVERRETMGEMDWAAKVAEAKREKEDSQGTQGRRVHLVILEWMDHQDPRASEDAGEIQDLLGQLDRRETLATPGHLVTRATEATPSINVPSSKASRISAPAAMGLWSAPSSPRSSPSPWTLRRVSPRIPSAACETWS